MQLYGCTEVCASVCVCVLRLFGRIWWHLTQFTFTDQFIGAYFYGISL